MNDAPLEFEGCQQCGTCCRWPGQVRILPEEITLISQYLSLDEWNFIQRFSEVAIDRRGLVLREKENGECIFLTAQVCSIQPVKPKQCRDFPFHWHNPGLESLCAGMMPLQENRE